MTRRPRTPVRDPGLLLLRALVAGAPRGSGVELVEMTSTAWASATFTGARHTMRLTAGDDEPLAAWLAGLPEAQVRLAGHLLADLAVAAIDRRGGTAVVDLEALTIEAA